MVLDLVVVVVNLTSEALAVVAVSVALSEVDLSAVDPSAVDSAVDSVATCLDSNLAVPIQ